VSLENDSAYVRWDAGCGTSVSLKDKATGREWLDPALVPRAAHALPFFDLPGCKRAAKVRVAMARLIFESVDGERTEIPIESDPISIGRGAEADVDVKDVETSRHHCALLLWEDDWVIKDGHSRNGTWVNGRRVEVAVLKDGDIVRIGKTDLDFHTEKPQRGRERYAVLKMLAIATAEEAEPDEEAEEDNPGETKN
jgi:hypothetical protein